MEIERLLIGSPWMCIGFTFRPASLEARFYSDKTGLTTFEQLDNGRLLPDIFDVDWGWRWSESTPEALEITWSDGSAEQLDFEVADIPTSYHWNRNKNARFTSLLRLSGHLFPFGGGFPDGWPREYFGYKEGADD
jgi:hypothetical protein